MLQTLNSLANKISPHVSSPMSPNLPSGAANGLIDANANKLTPQISAHGTRIFHSGTTFSYTTATNNNNNNNNNINNNNNNNHNHNNNGPGDEKNEESYTFSSHKRIDPIINGSCDKHTSVNLDVPDPDYIKMFVGQIPRTMDEEDLKKMFSEYGRVHQINVLRDKQTGQSKGCCFLTYYTRKAALDAQNALHNIKTLPGMHHPIQMKPADSENRNERKLFVGMLSKKCNESDIRHMFEHFGTIEECTVLRDTNGHSKGCAFVTFTSKQCAINAIRAMHQSHTMEGCSSPLVVKFADTQKDKDQKKLQQMHSNIWNMGINLTPQSYLATAALTQQLANNTDSHSCLTPLQLLQQQIQASAIQNGHSNLNGSLGSLLLHNSQSSDLHGINALNGTTCHNLTDINPVNLQSLATLANLSVANTAVNPIHVQNLMSLAAITGGNTLSPAALSGLTSPATTGLLSTPSTTLSGLTSNGLNGYTSGNLSLSDLGGSMFTSNINRELAVSAAGKQIEGPEGANLFIYHLPQECTDLDLASMFVPFGNVISAKVFIDKHTNLSKCFGFVSYDNALSAQNAIQNMNCFQIGTKRLKVQLKRPKDASKPY